MYEYIKGKLKVKKPEYVIVEHENIGYKIFVPISTYYMLPDTDSEIKLFVEQFIKEDRPILYGFYTREEREIFLEALKVPGIGTKTGIALLSGMEVEKLLKNIVNHKINEISKIPGIGKKTAERLCLELKDKFSKKVSNIPHKEMEVGEIYTDLTSALTNLGYSKKSVEKVVDKVLSQNKGEKIEELIKKALSILSGV